MGKEVVAESILYAVDKDGREFEIGVLLGQPYEHELGDWACPVAMVGLHGRFPDIHGIDSFQSITVALRLVAKLLAFFVEDGGKLYREKGGDEISVAELFGDVTETPEPEWPPDAEQQARIDNLTAEEIQKIDEAILANASTQWLKVARVAGSAMDMNLGIVPRIPDLFYAERVRQLTAAGKLESQGDLARMRFSEVRLPQTPERS